MVCPKCQSQRAEPIVSWTISGRKMTVPQMRWWACLNLECQHQWTRNSRIRRKSRVSPTPSSNEPGGSVWTLNGLKLFRSPRSEKRCRRIAAIHVADDRT